MARVRDARSFVVLVVVVHCGGCIGPVPTPTFGAPPRPHEWSCEFPKEADEAGVDNARVRIRVHVAANGRATGATIVGDDPGHGFGAAALECAGRQHYVAALDAAGCPAAATTDIWVHFTRPPQGRGPP
jgi:TonB family protein